MKTDSHGNKPIRIIKLRGITTRQPLKLWAFLINGSFPASYEKEKIIQVDKKDKTIFTR